MIRSVFLLTITILLHNTAFAASDSIVISQLVGGDTNPPTVPTSVTATPVTQSQIDIAWQSSTDDQSLSGYRLFRDAVQIATTSLTTYSDTGLVASTTYTYTVQAYDWFFNISSSSAPVSTTTPSVPVLEDVSESSPSTGAKLSPRLVNLTVNVSETSVNFSWVTNMYTRFALRWGRVSAYNLGVIQSDVFTKTHSTLIRDLEPSTKYEYLLFAYNQEGKEFLLSKSSFTTAGSPDTDPPSNVSGLRAKIEGESVFLTWNNPQDSDFSKVRVVRNSNFYPGDPVNGFVIYEGDAETLLDKDVFSGYGEQYYSVFTYDTKGNVSSGAVIMVRKKNDSLTQSDGNQEGNESYDTNSTTTEVSTLNITFSQVEVYQHGAQVFPSEGVLTVSANAPTRVKIPYELLPEHLKTVLLTFNTDAEQPVSYLLRVNKDKTAYEAILPPFGVGGLYNLQFSIYDFQTELLTTFKGRFIVEGEDVYGSLFLDTADMLRLNAAVSVGAFLLMILFFYFRFLRRKAVEDKYTV